MSRDISYEFIFQKVYDVAALIETAVNDPDCFGELDWNDARVMTCLIRCSKLSILHYFIYSIVAAHWSHDYRKNGDLFEEDIDLQYEIEATLSAYDIEYIGYDTYCSSHSNTELGDQLFFGWFLSQETAFEHLWNAQTEEAFHLLFANRTFLLQFNKSLGNYLSAGNIDLPAEFINQRGRLKRQSAFPQWLKRAIFFRDQGRCVFCQKDLTGLIHTAVDRHIDHIVPLNNWGTNDPCNLQLLCAKCNAQKSDGEARTSKRYVPWWDY